MLRPEDRATAPQATGPSSPASPRDQDLRRMEMQGYATMMPFLALHEVTQGKMMSVLVKSAQLFLITFAFVTPILLLIAYG